MSLPTDEQIWERVRTYADRCRIDNTPVYTLRKGVKNRITAVTESRIFRFSDDGRPDGKQSSVSKRDIIALWRYFIGAAPQPTVLYFTYALMTRALGDLLSESEGEVKLRADAARPAVAGPKELERQAAVLWTYLCGLARKKSSESYSEVGAATGIFRRNLRRPLDSIEEACTREQTPRLAVLVVDKTSGLPRDGFMLDERQTVDDERARVLAFPWDRTPNPFEYALSGESECSLAEKLLAGAGQPLEVYRRVRARGQAQVIFRAALLEAYDCACAFCGLALAECLEAAHIHPWSACAPEDRMNPCNGLLLCANHHRMFDANRIVVGSNRRITTSHTTDPRGAPPLFDQVRLPALASHYPAPRFFALRESWMKRRA